VSLTTFMFPMKRKGQDARFSSALTEEGKKKGKREEEENLSGAPALLADADGGAALSAREVKERGGAERPC